MSVSLYSYFYINKEQIIIAQKDSNVAHRIVNGLKSEVPTGVTRWTGGYSTHLPTDWKMSD